jgi:hypothetical protein
MLQRSSGGVDADFVGIRRPTFLFPMSINKIWLLLSLMFPISPIPFLFL